MHGTTRRCRHRCFTSQQALDGQQDGADVVQRRPFVLQDVEADEALIVHVGMETRRDELHSRSLVRVTGRKLQREAIPEALVYLPQVRQSNS